MAKNTAVFGLYRDRTSVENAVDALRAQDFRNTDISVLFPENEGTKDFAHEKNTKAPEGTATGATSGAEPAPAGPPGPPSRRPSRRSARAA